MIEAVIFDIGGVLVTPSPTPEVLLETFGLDAGLAMEPCVELLREHERGALDEATFWERFRARFNVNGGIPEPSPLLARYTDEVRPVPEVVALADACHARGLRVALLSDTIPAHAGHLRAMGLLDRYDQAVLSYEEGCHKPEPEIFRRTLARLGTAPEATGFVDDRAVNVDAARELGLRAHLFTSAGALRADLGRWGVLAGAAGGTAGKLGH